MMEDKDNRYATDPQNEPYDEEDISKSQRKRDADSVRELGTRLAELGFSELSTIPLTEDVLAAIHELNRIKAHGARKRQLGFLAKRLRQLDIEPIEQALEQLRQAARANTLNLHLVERWRDRLLGQDPDESAKAALTTFLSEYVEADRQQFRHLQRQALAERDAQRSPAAARQLFKAIRDVVLAPPTMLKRLEHPISLVCWLVLSSCATFEAPPDPPVAHPHTQDASPSVADITKGDNTSRQIPPAKPVTEADTQHKAEVIDAPAISQPQPATLERLRVERTQLTGYIENEALSEISGLAAATRTPGLLFAINDSGHQSALYALNESGEHVARWLIDAKNRDWEDMATTTINGTPFLVLGDIGDNRLSRTTSVLHFIEEPRLETPQDQRLKPARSLYFTYEDGPRNVEALGIVNNTAYLISKEAIGPNGSQASRLYELDLTEKHTERPSIARLSTELALIEADIASRLAAAIVGVDLNHPTALDFDSRGKTAYLLTYRDIIQFTRSDNQTWTEAFAATGKHIHSHGLRQAEALSIANDTLLWFTSEHSHAPLWAIPLQPPS